MGAWSRARELAERTPESRNRYVDFLRALSILAVVVGHWLMAAPWMDTGHLALENMLGVSPAMQWLTWVFQVMPVFFIVGGYSNAASWTAALRGGRPYGAWVAARLRRLIGPIVPLVLCWAGLASVGHYAGVSPTLIRYGSQAALIPIWFLAVYLMVVVLVPVTHRVWRRFGSASFWALALGAVAVDAIRFAGGLSLVGWVNYVFVWLAVHQLGYMWRDGRLGGARHSLPWMAGGAALMLALVGGAGYPVSMVSVPGEAVSNTKPPSLAMLGLALLNGGLLLALEGPARRWLRRTRVWAATIVVNGTIMSVYLWHLTAMVLLIGLLRLAGGTGMHLVPGSSGWWLSRPVWMAGLGAVLAVLLAIFGRFERLPEPAAAVLLSVPRVAAGSVLLVASLASMAIGGIGSEGPPGVRFGVVLAALGGAWLVGLGPQPRRARPSPAGDAQ